MARLIPLDTNLAPMQCLPTTVIGREAGDLLLPDSTVSKRHAVIRNTSDGWQIEDLQSRNGTYVNEKLVSGQVPLHNGDSLRIGQVELTFESNEIQSSPASASYGELSDGRVLIIGRSADADIRVDEAIVSRKHASLAYGPNGMVLTDLGSANGTYVNNQRVNQSFLTLGDQVRIGATEFEVSEEGLVLASPKGPVRLDVQGVFHSVNTRQGWRQLLSGVDFTVLPGELVAVVGSSGAGKTSLLRVLTGLESPDSGIVALNGVDYHSSLRQLAGLVGFVPQEDIVHKQLSVTSALEYAARLRLPSDTLEEEICERVLKVMEAVGLLNRAESEIASLSGGEKKRVNVALELLTEPNVLYLDEPTSGLDPHRERQMMELLRGLAKQGRTVVVTTHSVQSLDLCDLMLVMAPGGYLVYYGPPKDALPFFEVTRFEELFSKCGEEPESAREQYLRYSASSVCLRYGANRGLSSLISLMPPLPALLAPAKWLRQLVLLTSRYLAVVSRDRMNFTILMAQAPVLAVILAFVFPSDSFDAIIGSDGSTPLRYASVVAFLLCLISIWFGTSNSVREIVKESSILARERMTFLSPSAYLASKFIVLTGLCCLQCVLLVALVGLRMNWFEASTTDLIKTFGLVLLAALGGVGLGLTVSALSKSSDQAVSLLPLLLVPQVIFSGLFLPESSGAVMEAVAKCHLSYWSYAALGQILAINEKVAALPVRLIKESNEFEGALLIKVMVLLALLVVSLIAACWATYNRRAKL